MAIAKQQGKQLTDGWTAVRERCVATRGPSVSIWHSPEASLLQIGSRGERCRLVQMPPIWPISPANVTAVLQLAYSKSLQDPAGRRHNSQQQRRPSQVGPVSTPSPLCEPGFWTFLTANFTSAFLAEVVHWPNVCSIIDQGRIYLSSIEQALVWHHECSLHIVTGLCRSRLSGE